MSLTLNKLNIYNNQFLTNSICAKRDIAPKSALNNQRLRTELKFSGKADRLEQEKWIIINEILDNNPEELVKGGINSKLADLIPEFKAVYDNKQHSNHEYTVGGHIIKSFEHLLGMPEFKKLPKGEQKTLLLVAAFHDIAKTTPVIYRNRNPRININTLVNVGYSQEAAAKTVNDFMTKSSDNERICQDLDHHKTSAAMTEKILSRMNVDNDTKNRIYKIVRHHTRLGNLAVLKNSFTSAVYYQKLDELKDILQNTDDLRLLYLFTQADIMAIRKDPATIFTNKCKQDLDYVKNELEKLIILNSDKGSRITQLSCK